MWNLLCSKKIYIKGKKKYKRKTKKKKTVTIVATVRNWEKKKKKKKSKMPHQNTITATVLAQCKHTECTVPKHCSDIAAKKSTNERLKKKKTL